MSRYGARISAAVPDDFAGLEVVGASCFKTVWRRRRKHHAIFSDGDPLNPESAQSAVRG